MTIKVKCSSCEHASELSMFDSTLGLGCTNRKFYLACDLIKVCKENGEEWAFPEDETCQSIIDFIWEHSQTLDKEKFIAELV